MGDHVGMLDVVLLIFCFPLPGPSLCFLQNTSTYAKPMHFACACGEAKDPNPPQN